jgi:prepilin-type N-terminal cleavage/methylation domain-containing protein
MMNRERAKGFTLLEVMIAIAILGILLMLVSQVMNGEIRMYGTASRQNEIEQKARTAMVRVMDEIKLNRFVYYSAGTDGYDSGVYNDEPDQPVYCLIDQRPKAGVLSGNLNLLPSGTKIYYDYNTKQLWYRDATEIHLIADEIQTFELVKETGTDHLLKIHIKAADPSSGAEQELLTWIRMY